MKITAFLILSIIATLSLVSADVRVTNNVFEAILTPTGSLTLTSNSVNDARAIGFVCGSLNCATVNGTLFQGQTIMSQGHVLTLDYPTIPLSPPEIGYGVYIFKEGYIPFELSTNWSGTGQRGPYSLYLTKKAVCSSTISNVQTTASAGQVQLSARVNAPINHGGALQYVPTQIADQYTVDVNVTFKLQQGSNVIQSSQIVNIPYSDNRLVTATLQVPAGNYTTTITTTVPDSVCLSTLAIAQNSSIIVPAQPNQTDTTPPAPITNLQLESKTNTTITWNWTNPSDSDFANVRIFIDGALVSTTQTNRYTASSLAPNSTHTITVNTADTSGNVNPTNVSNTQTTLGSSSTETTPPGPVSNLHTTSVTSSNIVWSWINPTDADFSKAIIYLNGVNVANSSSTQYLASNLAEDTEYTITINTVDTSGNINRQNVTDSVRTSENNPGDHHDNDNSETRRSKNFASYEPIVSNRTVQLVDEEPTLVAAPKKAQLSIPILLLLIGSAILLLLILLVLLLNQ